MPTDTRLKIAIVGTGISGLSAAWLLSQRHDVTVYERADRVGGHSNTVVASIGRRAFPSIPASSSSTDDLSQSDGAVRAARRADPDVGHVVCRVDRRRRARIFRQRAVGALRPSRATCSGPASGRCSRTSCDSTGRRRSTPQLIDDEQVSLGDYLERAGTATPSATTICCRWRARSGRPRRPRCCLIRPRRSFVSTTITACCSCAAPGLGDRRRRQPHLCRTTDAVLSPIGSGSIRRVRKCAAAGTAALSSPTRAADRSATTMS